MEAYATDLPIDVADTPPAAQPPRDVASTSCEMWAAINARYTPADVARCKGLVPRLSPHGYRFPGRPQYDANGAEIRNDAYGCVTNYSHDPRSGAFSLTLSGAYAERLGFASLEATLPVLPWAAEFARMAEVLSAPYRDANDAVVAYVNWLLAQGAYSQLVGAVNSHGTPLWQLFVAAHDQARTLHAMSQANRRRYQNSGAHDADSLLLLHSIEDPFCFAARRDYLCWLWDAYTAADSEFLSAASPDDRTEGMRLRVLVRRARTGLAPCPVPECLPADVCAHYTRMRDEPVVPADAHEEAKAVARARWDAWFCADPSTDPTYSQDACRLLGLWLPCNPCAPATCDDVHSSHPDE